MSYFWQLFLLFLVFCLYTIMWPCIYNKTLSWHYCLLRRKGKVTQGSGVICHGILIILFTSCSYGSPLVPHVNTYFSGANWRPPHNFRLLSFSFVHSLFFFKALPISFVCLNDVPHVLRMVRLREIMQNLSFSFF